ncbi:TetR/AcrR family transcriptional regulator [Gordonia araii NBRC 100433]|nr:TetR/AcrR family transcriptional regulator [Gordonia araii]NNG96465.1 TetR/AcrR family transcriptional regulator [Gordonia araii NBRC 100433]
MAAPSEAQYARRTQEQRSAETRAKLLNATIDCLVEYGYSGTTTSRVAERAGVTRGAQLHHFGSRNDLVSAAVQHLAARRTADAVEQVGALQASPDPVSALLELLWDLHNGPLFTASIELLVAARTDPELRIEVAKFERVVNQTVAAMVAEYLPSGSERAVREFVFTSMDALRGILFSAYIDADPGRTRRRWERASQALRATIDPKLLTPAPAGDPS